MLNSSIIFNLWQSFFCYGIQYSSFVFIISFYFVSLNFGIFLSNPLLAALFDSFLCVFVSMLASQMKWFSVAYSAKSTKSYICNFNFHPFVMVVNSTIFPLSFSPMNGMKQMNGYNFTDARLLNNALHLLNLPFLPNVKLIN